MREGLRSQTRSGKYRGKSQAAIKDFVSENEVFQKVFGKEHPEYVRSMRLEVTSSQINALKEKNLKFDELMEAIAFLKHKDNARKEEIELLMQMQNSSGRQGLESSADGRSSSKSSYQITDNESSK
ncbi:hypothetical protein KIW84_076240 [Lathyrus oleraceus]|uniref:Uncharacterized protein n=1 Tax=Pisum sativum TaxID=3888 RepID=A0A9D4VXK0_PEA|nr:hypothetical protein KIW84_076240 [Pisum sativum]